MQFSHMWMELGTQKRLFRRLCWHNQVYRVVVWKLRAEKPEQSKRTGPDGTRLLSPAYWAVGREQKQQSITDRELPSLWGQGRSPSRHQEEHNSLLTKEKWPSGPGMGGESHSAANRLRFPRGLFLKSSCWSGFCLVWRSSNLTANFSRSEKWLTRASTLWGKVAKLPNPFFLLKTEEQQHLFKC